MKNKTYTGFISYSNLKLKKPVYLLNVIKKIAKCYEIRVAMISNEV